MIGRFLAHSVVTPPPRDQKGCLPEWVVSVTLGGEVTYHTPSGDLVVERGHVVIVHPNTPQHWRVTSAESPWRCRYCIFEPTADQLALLRYAEQVPGYSRLEISDRPTLRGIASAFHRLEALQHDTSPRVGQLRTSEMTTLLLWVRSSQDDNRALQDRRVTEAMDYMQRNMDRSLTIEDVAKAV